jgi:hypothetical protein
MQRDLFGDVISIVSGFDEYWIEMERFERIIRMVEGRRSEIRTRTGEIDREMGFYLGVLWY